MAGVVKTFCVSWPLYVGLDLGPKQLFFLYMDPLTNSGGLGSELRVPPACTCGPNGHTTHAGSPKGGGDQKRVDNPTAFEAHMQAEWLHKPCRPGGPHVGNLTTNLCSLGGPHVGKLST